MHDQTKPLIIIVLPFTLIFKPIFNRFLHFRQSFNHSNLLWSHLFVIIPTYSWSFPPPLSHSHLLYHSHLFLLIQTSSWSFKPLLDHSYLLWIIPTTFKSFPPLLVHSNLFVIIPTYSWSFPPLLFSPNPKYFSCTFLSHKTYLFYP